MNFNVFIILATLSIVLGVVLVLVFGIPDVDRSEYQRDVPIECQGFQIGDVVIDSFTSDTVQVVNRWRRISGGDRGYTGQLTVRTTDNVKYTLQCGMYEGVR